MIFKINLKYLQIIFFIFVATQSLDLMQKGTRLTKVRGKGKRYKRGFKLDDDMLSISYGGSKKWFGGNQDCKGEYLYAI